ncbi:MAG: rcc01693 family protein [Pseudomonadota bacterium]
MPAPPIDWDALMRAGLGRLRLAPDAFWAMTPLELMRALEGAGVLAPGGGPVLGRPDLDRLMAAYPDANASTEETEDGA